MKTIDCRQMACPAPVVATKKALEESGGEVLEVLLDDGAPRENVARFARNRGFEVEERPSENGWSLQISGGGAATASGPAAGALPAGERLMLVTSNRLGDGPEELGQVLMKAFLSTLPEVDAQPDRIIFVNTGVLLTVAGSEALEALTLLEQRGVELLSCGLCLDFFRVKDQLAVGKVTNMLTTAEGLLTAGSVIRI